MFKVGEYVIYVRNICIVDKIEKNKTSNKESYVLKPIYDESLTINIPVDNKIIKKLSTKKEIKELIESIDTIEDIIITNEKELEKEYKKLLHENLRYSLLKILKSAYKRNKEKRLNNKKLSEIDNKYIKMVEKVLFAEISIVLEITIDEAKEMIRGKLNYEE